MMRGTWLVMLSTATTVVGITVPIPRDGGDGAGMVATVPELASLQERVTANAAELSATEHRGKQLSNDWDEVADHLHRAIAALQTAREGYERARGAAERASTTLQKANAQWNQAEEAWRLYQILVAIAAQVDARNIDAWRASNGSGTLRGSLSCEPMSTATFRRRLEAKGVELTGLEVDHIVPRSLGGADHPDNYQLISKSENRSLGATWDVAKCASAGMPCIAAVAVSRRCGSFGGA